MTAAIPVAAAPSSVATVFVTDAAVLAFNDAVVLSRIVFSNALAAAADLSAIVRATNCAPNLISAIPRADNAKVNKFCAAVAAF